MKNILVAAAIFGTSLIISACATLPMATETQPSTQEGEQPVI
jgi:hypothetical protein